MPTPPKMTNTGVIAELAEQMQDLVRVMAEDQADGLQTARVAQFAVAAMPGADHAGISLARGMSQRPYMITATDDLPVRVDQLQYDLGEGPSLQVLTQSDVVRTDDLAHDEQWPRFGPRASELIGVRSMLSFRLFLTAEQRGALNYYAARPHAFDEEAVGIGSLFAAYSSLTMLNTLHRDKIMNLERALESNREIGVAIGILMAHERCTQSQAFDQLRVASQHAHRKLRDIAEEVRLTGALPTFSVSAS
jgi:hypothetical protein